MNLRYTHIILFVLGLSFAWPVQAQLKRANRKFDQLAYSPAARLYHKYLKKEAGDWDAITRLADSYRLINDSKNAEYWYGRAVKNRDTDPMNYFYYGQALMHNQKWDAAVPWFEKFLEKKPNDPVGMRMLESSKNYQDFMKDSTLYNVKITNINSEEADFSPAFYQNQVIFASARNRSRFWFSWTDRYFLDLFASEYREKRNWENRN